MSKNPDQCETDRTQHALGDDVLLNMGHKKYKASIAYARALFYFATQFNILRPISEEFGEFIHVWQKLPIMKQFIRSHAIDRYTRKDCIKSLFEDRVHKSFLCFIQKVIDNNHTDLFPGIYDAFSQMADEVTQKRRLRVISAFPMTASQKKRLQDLMENFLKLKVIIKNDVDPGILGGFVCYTDSIKIDMSLKKDLDKLKSQILTAPCVGG